MSRYQHSRPQSHSDDNETKHDSETQTQAKLNARKVLRAFIISNFSLSELKDLAFDLGIGSDHVPASSIPDMARQLIEYCERRGQMGCLLEELVKARHKIAEPIVGMITIFPPCHPNKKVQIIILNAEISDAGNILNEVARLLNLSPEEVSLIAASVGSLRLLVGIPEGAAERLLSTESFADREYHLGSIRDFNALGAEEQKEWRALAESWEPLSGSQVTYRELTVRTLNGLGNLARNHSDYDLARRLYQEALLLSLSSGDSAGLARAMEEMGRLALQQKEFSQAQVLIRRYLATVEQVGDKAGQANAFNMLGEAAMAQNNYEDARDYYLRSIEISAELEDRAAAVTSANGIANSLYELGHTAGEKGDFEQAREYYQESLEIFEQVGNQADLASTLYQLGVTAQVQREYQQAREYYQKSRRILEQLGEIAGVAAALHNLGTIAEEEGDREEAQRLFEEALAILEHLESPNADIVRQHLAQLDS